MSRDAIHICSFESGPTVTRRTTYEELKAAVLKAGRFSAFEADANDYAASLYYRLCRDPSVEVTKLGYPWTGVRAKENK